MARRLPRSWRRSRSQPRLRPGFSPLVGSALDHFFGWRSEFAFVAIFAICAGAAYVVFVGETKAASDSSVHPLGIAGSYLGLLRDAQVRGAGQDRQPADGRLVRRFLRARRACFSKISACRRSRSVCCSPASSSWCSGPGCWRQDCRRGSASIAQRWSAWDWPFWEAIALLARGPGREELAAAVSRHRFDLPVRPGNREPAVECGRAIAIRRQGRRRRRLVRLRANGRGGLRRVAGAVVLDATRPSGLERAGPDIACSRWSCTVGKGGRSNRRRFFHGHRTRGSASSSFSGRSH